MTAPHATDIINCYLARLEAETADLPQTERRELIDGVREHLAEARVQMPLETDADLLPLLDQTRYFPMLYSRDAVEKQSRDRLVLAPLVVGR